MVLITRARLQASGLRPCCEEAEGSAPPRPGALAAGTVLDRTRRYHATFRLFLAASALCMLGVCPRQPEAVKRP